MWCWREGPPLGNAGEGMRDTRIAWVLLGSPRFPTFAFGVPFGVAANWVTC